MIENVLRSGLKSPQKIILPVLVILLISGPALAATITVQPGESIQEAIDQSHSGDVIEVMSGTYKECGCQ